VKDFQEQDPQKIWAGMRSFVLGEIKNRWLMIGAPSHKGCV